MQIICQLMVFHCYLYPILIFVAEAGKKKDSLLPDAIDVADNLQYWPERLGNQPAPRFSHIAALHSELVAVSTSGQVYQWRWADKDPYVHPEVSTLGKILATVGLYSGLLFQQTLSRPSNMFVNRYGEI